MTFYIWNDSIQQWDSSTDPSHLRGYLADNPELTFHFYPGGDGFVTHAYWSLPTQATIVVPRTSEYCVALVTFQ